MKTEYLYLLSNPSMPNLIKIGMTTNEPDERMQQLFSTGVPEQFILEYCAMVPSGADAEYRAHKALEIYRFRSNREFFQIAVMDAVAIIGPTIGPHKVHTDRQNSIRKAVLNRARKEVENSKEAIRRAEKLKVEMLVQQQTQKTDLKNQITLLQSNLKASRHCLKVSEAELNRLHAKYKRLGIKPVQEKKSFWSSVRGQTQYQQMFENFVKPWVELEAAIQSLGADVDFMRLKLGADEVATVAEVARIMSKITMLD
jgi:hypothetical protein